MGEPSETDSENYYCEIKRSDLKEDKVEKNSDTRTFFFCNTKSETLKEKLNLNFLRVQM